MSGMLGKSFLIFSLALSLSLAYTVISEEELNRLSKDVEQRFFNAHKNSSETGRISKELQDFYREFRLADDPRDREFNSHSEVFSIVSCLTCRSTVSTFLTYIRSMQKSVEEVESLAVGVCKGLNLYTDRVCENVVHFFTPILYYIIEKNPDLSSSDICAIVYQSENCGTPKAEYLKYDVQITGQPPEVKDHKGPAADSGQYFKIVHFTDLHFDPEYTQGNNAECKEPVCCRQDQGLPESGVPGAGRWGDYRWCDLPWATVEKTIQRIARAHADANFIYFTGDVVDHSVWSTSIEYNLQLLERVYNLMKQEFRNVVVLPTVGNHEAHPVNTFAPRNIPVPEFSSDYLYNYLSTAWSDWLPQSVLQTVRYDGRYTFLLAPGFRVVVLNNNLGYTYNFWVMHDPAMQRQHLQWLHDTLLQAETNREKVHILLHIPNGGVDSYRFWSQQYARIVDRFHHIITGQFCGHTHENEFNVFYDQQNANFATNVVFNGGSLTPYAYFNPNYVVYYVDKTSFEVIDQEVYFLNLTSSNSGTSNEIQWSYQYSFKSLWGLPDLSPRSMNSLVERLVVDPIASKKYRDLRGNDAEPHVAVECEGKCLTDGICRIVTTDYGDDRKCKSLGV